MQLGALIRRLEDADDAAQAMHALGDDALFARVAAMGQRHDETPGAYLAGAARRFAHLGGGEDWLALMTAIERADDPARAVLGAMLRWALARDSMASVSDGCGCGASAGMLDERG